MGKLNLLLFSLKFLAHLPNGSLMCLRINGDKTIEWTIHMTQDLTKLNIHVKIYKETKIALQKLLGILIGNERHEIV